MEIAVDDFNREAARIHAEYGIAISPERVFNTPENSGLEQYIEVAIGIVAGKRPVAVYGSDSRRWTGAQSPRQVLALHEAAGDNTIDYLTQMALNIEVIKAKQDDLDRSLKKRCLRPNINGKPCQMRPLYQAGVGHQDGFGCWRHATDKEKRDLEESRISIEFKTSCPGCKARAGETCSIPTEGHLTPAQAGLKMVDGEWPRVRVLGGADIHVPRIELIHPRVLEPAE
ncbi:hypothetical protein AXK56_16285 [Tsukamurella pulmonis]|uniref:Uncharacterized protein n=1 Tax=Tsukamurella pulmonis TaxID=47312 RepID=A0A1H1GAW1_9ACTN|nr:hypothetical protein AXK56_16285 [Tsukamurella pulmonis]SDR10287.1 hypothetical protein SAMN04489765_3218 [Tsukamurella pulmonis]SUP17556.1 Uncharacterised protein [Tsukamurella pulmonis]